MRSALRRAVPVVFLATSGALLLFGRRVVLRYDPVLNPDEAMLAAAAMLTNHGWLNWDIADTTSSGPFNATILAWPYLFGGDITLFSTRLAGVACTFGGVAFIFHALRRLSDDSTAIVATAPVFIFFSAATHSDFVHYSSELLPLFLLSAAFYLFVRSFEREALRYCVGAGLVLGCVPFAKLQAAPIAGVMGAFAVARVVANVWNENRRSAMLRASAVCGAGLLPALIVLVPLVVSGNFDAFLNGYLLERWLITVDHPWVNPLPSLIGAARFWDAHITAYGAMFVVAMAFLALFARHSGVRSTLTPGIFWISALAVVLTAISVISIIAPGNPYPHYLVLTVPAVVIAVGVALAVVAALTYRRAARRGAAIEGLVFGLMLAIILPAAKREQRTALETITNDAVLQGRLFTAAHNLDWLRPREKDRLVCWTWTPECYVDAAISPATRDITNEYQVYRTSLKPYFRARFLEEFARTEPDFIMDFVAPGHHAYGRPWFNQEISNFPEFARIIETDFDLVSRVEPADRCPRAYVRKTRLAELKKSLIKFASLSASASIPGHAVAALDDGSIFERCADNWLLPEGALGVATIRFHQAEPVRSVAMLSTRNGADRVRLSIHLRDRPIAAEELTLSRFPRWTWYRLDKAIAADGLTIEILSSHGPQAGLNEVKAYRD